MCAFGNRDVSVHRHRGVDRLMGGATPDAMQAALERHDAILRAVAHGLGGYTFSTGGME